MSYKQIKWLIILIPTITIGVWEYVRHEFLLPYISMDLGNLLSPVIVFFVTMIFVYKLITILERMKEDLEKEKAQKSILEEREKLSRELHDGIAQSLFLVSVKLNQLEAKEQLKENEVFQKLKKTCKHIHDDVRQAIFNLRNDQSTETFHWTNSLNKLITSVTEDTNIRVSFDWNVDQGKLSAKEKTELYACIKETLMNIRKHSGCKNIYIRANEMENGWACVIEDDGIGFNSDSVKKGYGIEIMKDRAKGMDWLFYMERINDKTRVTIKKER